MKGAWFRMWPGVVLAASLASAASASAGEVYVDAVDYPSLGAGREAFNDLEHRLEEDFDQICGDTYCEGEYSDYQPLRYRCSVRQRDGVVGQCVWTFAASEAGIDPASGQIQVDARLWHCQSPIRHGTRLTAFYAALAVENPLFAPLPHSTASLNDGLIDCL